MIIEEMVGQEFLTPHDWREWAVEIRSERGDVLVVPFSDYCWPEVRARVFEIGASVAFGE